MTWHRGLLLLGHLRAGLNFGGLFSLCVLGLLTVSRLERNVAVPYLGPAADAPLLAAAPRVCVGGGVPQVLPACGLGRLLLACVGVSGVSSFSADRLQPWHASGYRPSECVVSRFSHGGMYHTPSGEF